MRKLLMSSICILFYIFGCAPAQVKTTHGTNEINQLIKSQKYETAIQKLERIPKSQYKWNTHKLLVKAYMFQKDIGNAVKAIKNACRSDITYFSYSGNDWGNFLRDNGYEELALTLSQQLFTHSLQKDSISRWDWMPLKTALEEAGKYNQIDKLFESIRKNFPSERYAYEYVTDYYIDKGRYSEAISLWKKGLVKIDSESKYVSAGNFYKKIGNLDKAISMYRLYLNKKPTDRFAYKYLADAYLLQGKFSDAEALWNQGLSRIKKGDANLPHDISLHELSLAYSEMGDFYKKADRIDKAIPIYEKCLATKSSDSWLYGSYEDLANAYLEAGRVSDAENLWEQGLKRAKHHRKYYLLGEFYKKLGDYNKSLSFFKKYVESTPDYYFAYQSLLDAYFLVKDYGKAEDLLKNSINYFPDKAGNLAKYQYYLIRKYQMDGDWNKADAIINQLLREDPDKKYLFFEQARSHAAQNRQQEAIEYLKKYLTYQDSIIARPDIAFKNFWEDDNFSKLTDQTTIAKKMIDDSNKKIKKDPRDLYNIISLMQNYRRAQMYDSAIALGNKALKNINKYKNKNKFQVWVYDELARIYKIKRNSQKAEKAYRNGIKAVGFENKQVVNIIINYSAFLVNLKRYNEAITNVLKAKVIGASSYGEAQIESILTVSNYHLGNKDKTNRYLTKLESLSSADPVGLAKVYAEIGEFDKAVEAITSALTDPVHNERVIRSMQNYLLQKKELGGNSPGKKAFDALKNKNQVVEAISKYGRIANINSYGWH